MAFSIDGMFKNLNLSVAFVLEAEYERWKFHHRPFIVRLDALDANSVSELALRGFIILSKDISHAALAWLTRIGESPPKEGEVIIHFPM